MQSPASPRVCRSVINAPCTYHRRKFPSITILAEKLRADGLDVQTVGELLGDAAPLTVGKPQPIGPATLEGTPPLPEPGIYFGMSDEEYHALPALSNSGVSQPTQENRPARFS